VTIYIYVYIIYMYKYIYIWYIVSWVMLALSKTDKPLDFGPSHRIFGAKKSGFSFLTALGVAANRFILYNKVVPHS